MNFLRSVSSIGGFTILSRITGYLRDLLMANLIGVSILSDAMALAIKFPGFFRRIFAEGAFHVSFLPLYTKLKRDPAFSGMILSLLGMMLIGLVVGVEIFFPQISAFVFGGLSKKPETLALVIQLGRITFPYVFFICLTSFFGSILNAYGHFSLYSASHAVGNGFVVLCAGVLSFYSQSYGVLFSWTVLASGVLQCGCLLASCMYYGYDIRPRWPRLTPEIRQFFCHFFPNLLSVGALQLNMLVGFYLGSMLAKGGLSYLYYADRLNQLPYSIVGVSLSSILLPLLSKYLREGQLAKANKTQNYAFRFAAFTALPATMFLLVLAFPMIDLLFGHGKINALQVIEIGKTVMAFSLGIPAHIANKIITTRFFAQGQPKYPLQASVLMVVLDIVLSVLLIRWLEHVGLALAMALAAWGSTLFLLFVIQQKHGWTVSKALRRFLWRIVLSCVISGALLCALQAILPAFRACSLPQQLGLLSGFLTLGTLLLFACFSYFRILSKRQWNILWKSFKKRGNNVEVL